jgi:hypothetical protein
MSSVMIEDGSIQQRADDAFQVWGRSAPPMRAGENDRSYIRRIARIAQKKNYLAYDEKVKRIDFDQLPDHALPQFTEMLLNGIRRSVTRSDTVPDGTERQVFSRDENTGLATRSFIRPDNESFVKEFTRPCRRVVTFRTPHGLVDANLQFVR